MSTVVDRTCTELHDADSGGETRLLTEVTRSLSKHRSVPAYVLLGDPGAGKTTEFEQESEQLGDATLMISARDFVTLDLDSHPDWRERVLFIDGLDEMRAGRSDSRVPLDEIRNRLDQLRPPGFRLSCREADWLGHSDRHSLKAVSPDSSITVLRLDPLSEQSAIKLLESKHSVPDGREFMAEAHRLGLSGMLGNPLTLCLLADAVVEGGAWPESRLEAFEAACRKMAAEANLEHLAVIGARPVSAVLDSAGYLCALQLLSGEAGYSLPTSAAMPSSVALSELSEAPSGLSQEDLAHALGTKLFTAVGEGVFAPVHRQIAEFLAGRYLAEVIGRGLPARRVAALMIGTTDDRVVTSLRGLSAWLAAHSREARPILIDADPVGVGLYGDLGNFSTDEKRYLVKSLSDYAARAPLFEHGGPNGRSHDYRGTAWAFRSLATADMVPTMKELLSVSSDDTSDYQLISLIFGTLSHARNPQSLIDLQEDLEAIIGSKATRFRRRALNAYLHIVPSSNDRTQVLRMLLDNIQDGSVPDLSDAVRGILLKILYLDAIKPAEVWRYAVGRNRDYPRGPFQEFWYHTLLDKSSKQHLVELLDSLHADANRLIPTLEQSNLGDLPAILLAQSLEAIGDEHEPARLYNWLTTAATAREQSYSTSEYSARIRAWLESRAPVQQAVLLAALRQRGTDESFHGVRYRYYAALYGSSLPSGFGLWCLDQAIQVADTEPEVSEALLVEAHESLDDPSKNVGLTLEMMRERTRDHSTLAQYLHELCERRSSSQSSTDNGFSTEEEFRREMEDRLSQRDEERQRRREDWARQLCEQETELRENRFSPQNLATLAEVSLSLVVGTDRHASPRDRISDFIGDDSRLVDAVMTALQGAVSRDDVPEVDQTISWSLESRHSWLAHPVLAGLRILDREDPYRLDSIPETQKRKALAIHYCVPHDAWIPPFHDRWLHQDPEMVLDVLYRCAVADVRAGREVPSGLYELDAVDGFDDRLHDVRLRLLEAFPTRSRGQQLSLLDRLLTSALDNPSTKSLLKLARRKHAAKSMPVAQQVRWWATDALIVKGIRLQQLKTSLTDGESRVRHLAEFLKSVWDRYNQSSMLSTIRDPSTLKELIEIMGCWCTEPTFASGFVTLEMEISDMLVSLIRQLGAEAGDEAQRALAELVQMPDLEGWHEHLSRALEEQRVIHRDASYRHPTVEQVQETLRGGAPANAADLAALLVDRLDDIGQDLRGGSSDPWRPFWNEDGHRRPTTAKAEDSCRDALLEKLRRTLPDGVEAVREGSYAADARADIRVSCRGFNVPVEIKKDSHPDLWKAMRDQLMDKYTTNTDTEGHGIYLVLWFADANKPATRHPQGGMRPSTPEELKEWLKADLTPEEARQISVVLLDVTKPGSNSARARRGSATAIRQRRAPERESAAASSG